MGTSPSPDISFVCAEEGASILWVCVALAFNAPCAARRVHASPSKFTLEDRAAYPGVAQSLACSCMRLRGCLGLCCRTLGVLRANASGGLLPGRIRGFGVCVQRWMCILAFGAIAVLGRALLANLW